jgi:hypothetical protein
MGATYRIHQHIGIDENHVPLSPLALERCITAR